MEKKTIDQDRLRKHFLGQEDATEYLYSLCSDDVYNEELEHSLRVQWYDMKAEDEIPQRNLDHIIHKLNFEINQQQETSRNRSLKIYRIFSRVAAVLLIPLLIYSASHFFTSNSKKEKTWVKIVAPGWSRVQFNLPDGTIGWLNSNSRLKYDEKFSSKRHVVLDGEAYFDVKNIHGSHFRVHTADLIITVHGTKFNVESYKDENTVEVTLEEGKIDYYNRDVNRLYSMKPNDNISYNRASGELKIDVVQPEKYTAWKDGKLVFRNDPLDVVVRRLSRWYNVDIDVVGDITNQPMLRGTFVDDELEEILEILKKSLRIDYSIIRGVRSGETYSKTKVVITSKTE